MKASLLGAIVSTAITVLALPRTAATDTYWIIVGLGVLPYVLFGTAARVGGWRWILPSIVVYAAVDAALRAVRLLGPESVRNPLVVVTLPLLGAPLVVLAVTAAMKLWRLRRTSVSDESV